MNDPYATNRLAQTQELDNTQADPVQRDYLVLIAEDMTDILITMSLYLQQLGYRVVTATNGEEAVNAVALSRPDLILMDLAMPVLDGLGAARQIRDDKSLPYIPMVAITAFDTGGFLQAAYDVGFDGYLVKPVDFDRMAELIRGLLPAR